MTQHDLARVAVRLIAVIAFVYAAWLAGSAVGWSIHLAQMWFAAPGGGGMIVGYEYAWFASSVVAVLVLLVIAFILWFKSGYIAAKVVGPAAHPDPITQFDARVLLGVGCSLIGLWLVATGVMELTSMIVFGQLDEDVIVAPGEETTTGRIISELIAVGLGLYLLLGARGLIDLIHRARTAGLVQPTDDLSPPSP